MDNKTYLVILVCIALILIFLRSFLLHYLGSKLSTYLLTGESEKFDKLSNKKFVKYIMPPFNYYFLKLNKAIITQEEKEVEQLFSYFDKLRLNEIQKQAIYAKAFYYYLELGNEKALRKYYEDSKQLKDKKLFNSINDLYQIAVEKNVSLKDKYLEKYKENNKDQNAVYMLYLIYKNLNDERKQNKYLKIYDGLIQEASKKSKK